MPRYLIIGNSAAGTAAAQAIRRADPTGEVAILSDEAGTAYSRPRLPDFLSGQCPSQEGLAFRSPSFYQQHRIELLCRRAERIDLERHQVVVEGGGRLNWQKLLLATGSIPALPQDLAGKDGVFAFNSLADAERIKERIKPGDPAVVIGAGLIGFSAVKGLVGRGARVALVARSQRILSTLLDAEASALAEEALRAKGVQVITNSGGEAIVETGGKLRGVALGNSQELPARGIVLGRGVSPRLDLVQDTPLRANQGVVVDQYMATSWPEIYACGDVAEAPDAVLGSPVLNPNWPNAVMGGRVAGANMAGGKQPFFGVSFNSLNLLGFPVMAAGIIDPPLQGGFQAVVHRGEKKYRKLVLLNDRLVGMVLAGDIGRAGLLLELIRKAIPVNGFRQELLAGQLGYFSLPEEVRRQFPAGVRAR